MHFDVFGALDGVKMEILKIVDGVDYMFFE